MHTSFIIAKININKYYRERIFDHWYFAYELATLLHTYTYTVCSVGLRLVIHWKLVGF